jgi:Tfp pilus assembly protein PilV
MPRRGFTLLEVLTASVITVVIVGALASVMAVAAKAMPSPDAASTTTRAASIALQAAAADLALCKGLKSYDATSIQFTLVDRDADGSEETLNVAWGGSAGDPLVLDTNGVAQTIVEKVDDFAVSVETFSDSTTSVSGTTVGPQILLAGYEGTTIHVANVTTTEHVAQSFRASVPADAISYSITKLDVSVHQRLLYPGTVVVELYKARADGSPTGAALASATATSGLLALPIALPPFIGTRYQLTLGTPVTGCLPGDLLAIKLSASSGRMYAAFQNPAPSEHYATMSLSTNSGGSWTPVPSASIGFLVCGNVTRPATVAASVSRAESVAIKVRPTGGQEITLNVPLLGKPLTP